MKKTNLLLIFIIILGFFLRVYGIDKSFGFDGELGRELLYLRQLVISKKIPLVGLTTSHEWLSYGPIYYWFMLPIFVFLKGNPFILFWTAIVLSVFGLILNYLVIKKITNKKIALISTLIESLSPLLIWQTKLSKLHTFFFILNPVLMYLFYLLWQGNKKWVFWLGFTFGLMFSFHFSQIPLFGIVFVLFYIKRKFYNKSDWLKFTIGVTVPNFTFLLKDKDILLWIPYRVLNPLNKNFFGTFISFKEFFGRLLFWNNNFWFLGFLIFLLIFGHYLWYNKSRFKNDFLYFYLTLSIVLVIVANILHGQPPVHYFLPIFTVVPILYSIYLVKTKWIFLILIILFSLNFREYFNSRIVGGFVSYNKQIEVANFIVFDAQGKELSIKRVGSFDYFPENYSQNYKYLILWKGGNLIENSSNIYKIIENGENIEIQK